jgi:hypothetical protein
LKQRISRSPACTKKSRIISRAPASPGRICALANSCRST